MPLVNISPLKRSSDAEHSVDHLDSKRGKYPRLTTLSPSIPENRSSLRRLPKTADIPWGTYQRPPERDKTHGIQDAEGRNFLFRVTKKPTSYLESNEEFEIVGDFSSFKEARDFIQHHLLTLEDENALILTQKTNLKAEGEDGQTLLRVVGPNWDISIAAHRIWDEVIDMGDQPDAIEHSRRIFYSGEEALRGGANSDGDARTTDGGDDQPPRLPPMESCVTGKSVDMASEAATANAVPISSKRSSEEIGSPSTCPATKRHKISLMSPKSSIRDASEAEIDGIGEVEEAHQKPLPPDSTRTEAEPTDKALTAPLRVYTVKETSFESFKAKDETIIGLFTTLADAIKQVRACWEVCIDRKYSNVEYLDDYHEDGRLWWTCRDEEGDGYDVDIELNIVKPPGSEAGHHSQGTMQKPDLAGEEIEAKFYESDGGTG
ncbi:hypothetical protein DL98DRAFT_528341 [Cadophora sp. DSE1049]|nr:hypothetical protein DL98DRAFT_528341 [Cadophora sp. DSE1049]